MNVLVLTSTFGPISIVLMLLVIGELSRRLGEVVKASYMHRWFYLAATLASVSMFVKLLSGTHATDDFDIANVELAVAYIAPLALSLFIGIVAAWRYWGWLIYASEFSQPSPKK
jgi:hypothetical protein